MIDATPRRALLAAIFWATAVVCGLIHARSLLAESAPAASFQEIEESLTCQCGCGLTVHSCNHLQCPSALPLRAEIREQMALGKSKQDILAYFGGKYGEKILSSPTAEGFNVLAWITPFIAVGIGLVIVLIASRRWAKRRAEEAAPPPAKSSPTSPYDDVLVKELKDFDA